MTERVTLSDIYFCSHFMKVTQRHLMWVHIKCNCGAYYHTDTVMCQIDEIHPNYEISDQAPLDYFYSENLF